MTAIPPALPGLPLAPMPQAAVTAAVVSAPVPAQLSSLALNATIDATLISAGRGTVQVALAGAAEPVTMRMALPPLTAGSNLVLQMVGQGAVPLLRLLAVNGQPVNQTGAPIPPPPPQGAAAAPAPAVSPQPQSPPAPIIATLLRPPSPQLAAGTAPAPTLPSNFEVRVVGVTPPPAAAEAWAPAAPGAEPLMPPVANSDSPEPTATRAIAPLPVSNPRVATPPQPTSQPAAMPPIPTPSSPPPAAVATPPAPSTAPAPVPGLAPVPVPVSASPVQAAPIPAGSVPSLVNPALVAGGPPPSAPPSPLPLAPPPLPPASSPPAPPVTTLSGIVAANSNLGQTLVQTDLGLISLNVAADIPPGARIDLEVMGPLAPPAAPPDDGLPQVRPAGWPGLASSLAVLKEIAPEAAETLVGRLPQPGPHLAFTLAAVAAAASNGRIWRFLGEESASILVKAGRHDLAAALERELSETGLQPASSHAATEWQAWMLPLLVDGRVERIRLMTRQRSGSAEAKARRDREGARFLIDLDFKGSGAMQLDGLVKRQVKRFDLIVRTHQSLPVEMRQDIRALFANSLDGLGMTGEATFQQTAVFVAPDIAKQRPDVTI